MNTYTFAITIYDIYGKYSDFTGTVQAEGNTAAYVTAWKLISAECQSLHEKNKCTISTGNLSVNISA